LFAAYKAQLAIAPKSPPGVTGWRHRCFQAGRNGALALHQPM
jgi:hypothetical protein